MKKTIDSLSSDLENLKKSEASAKKELTKLKKIESENTDFKTKNK